MLLFKFASYSIVAEPETYHLSVTLVQRTLKIWYILSNINSGFLKEQLRLKTLFLLLLGGHFLFFRFLSSQVYYFTYFE
jgi:hypothetical protein